MRRLRAVTEVRYEVHGQPSVGPANARHEHEASPYMRRNGGPTSSQGLVDPEYVDLQFVVDQQVWRYQIATTFVQNLDAIEQMQSAGRRRVDGVQGIDPGRRCSDAPNAHAIEQTRS